LRYPNSLRRTIPERARPTAHAYETVTGEEEMPDDGSRHPREPAGEPWDKATVAEKYPQLATKFGWDISNE
jgi:hypothetical protein